MQRGQNLSLEQLHIPHPCAESWTAMSGTDRRRHCMRCDKDVHDLSMLTRKEAEALCARAGVCIRISRNAAGEVLTSDRLPFAWIRQGLDRSGLRLISKVLLLVAPLVLASCRRAQVLAGTPLPSTPVQTATGEVAPPAPEPAPRP
jgi:hypothetical protein